MILQLRRTADIPIYLGIRLTEESLFACADLAGGRVVVEVADGAVIAIEEAGVTPPSWRVKVGSWLLKGPDGALFVMDEPAVREAFVPVGGAW